jgi:hypothetical protein
LKRVSGSAWQKDVKAGFPDARPLITLFRRGNSATLFPREQRPRADYRGEERDMSTAYTLATVVVLIGLLMTGLGIGLAARAVNIDEETAAAIAAIRLDRNRDLEATLIVQSRAARRGLWTIFVGTMLQALGTAVPLYWT